MEIYLANDWFAVTSSIANTWLIQFCTCPLGYAGAASMEQFWDLVQIPKALYQILKALSQIPEALPKIPEALP